ncbi:SRPBCC domain-containing protein [Streptomyces sp. NPDC002004]
MSEAVAQGTSRTAGNTQTLQFTVRPAHPVEEVWRAVATARGLHGWLAAADTFEPRLGGAITLRWLNTSTTGEVTVASGQITAWDVERVAEYTLKPYHGRVRFHLEPAGGNATTLRFTNEFDGDDELRLDCLAGWHNHFEFLADALDGRPKDWSTWTFDRWEQLRELYASSG